MPSEDTRMLEYTWKSDKAQSFIDADLESLIKEADRYKNNLLTLSAMLVSEWTCSLRIFNVYDMTFDGV